ncbi:MAG: hypothetical protein KA096_00575 [Bacteroidales bacterium]|nr:hypothetical protein [Bacteroidales bacterium]
MHSDHLPGNGKIFRKLLFRISSYTLFAYFLSFIAEKLLVITGAFLFDFKITWLYNKLIIKGADSDWTQENVLIIYLMPLVIMAIIIVFIYLPKKDKDPQPRYKDLFLTWFAFFLVYRILGMIPFNLVVRTNVFFVFDWLYAGPVVLFSAGILSFILYLLITNKLLKDYYLHAALLSRNHSRLGNHDFMLASILVPLFITSIAATLFFLPGPPYEELAGLVMMNLPAVMIFIRYKLDPPVLLMTKKETSEITFASWIFPVCLLTVLAFRIILALNETMA